MVVGENEFHLTKIAFWPRFLNEGEITDIDAGPVDLDGIYRIALIAENLYLFRIE